MIVAFSVLLTSAVSDSQRREPPKPEEREVEEEIFAQPQESFLLILMENLSHSRNPNRSSLSKKPYNGGNDAGGFSYNSGKTANTTTTTTYDDVFGGPPRFGAPTLSPRLEDYCEIFAGFNGSSRAAVSSIPVLDLPLVDDRDVYFDVRSHGFDYREVFGGFNDLDLAPSYEELFLQQRSPVVGDVDSSDDAWYS